MKSGELKKGNAMGGADAAAESPASLRRMSANSFGLKESPKPSCFRDGDFRLASPDRVAVVRLGV